MNREQDQEMTKGVRPIAPKPIAPEDHFTENIFEEILSRNFFDQKLSYFFNYLVQWPFGAMGVF